MKMGTGTGGDCPDQGWSPFCAGASPHFLSSKPLHTNQAKPLWRITIQR